MSSVKQKYLPFFMWFLPLSFFAYQFILRLWPSLMMQDIMKQFAIDATGFGTLAASYYYGYSLMQIPIAVLLDKYGSRVIVSACAVLTGIAALVFSNTDSLVVAIAARVCIGIGSAVGFLGVSKVISKWFPKDQYARMVGFSFTIGLMGAIYGGRPISILIEDMGGLQVAHILGVGGIVIGFLTCCFLRRPENFESTEEKQSFNFTDFKSLLSSKIIWLIGISNFLMVGSLEGFADVWGVSYLQVAHGISKAEAAELMSFIFIGMIFGGPILAYLASKIGNYTIISFAGFVIALILTFILISDIKFEWCLFAVLFFVMGIMCCYQVLVFAIGSELMPTKLLSITIAFLQTMNMIGGSFFHTFIGKIMDQFWTGEVIEGLRAYTLDSYQVALMLIPACAIIGSIIVIFVGRISRK